MTENRTNAESRYLSREYLKHNPRWHEHTCRWKFEQIQDFLNRVDFERVVEVGCGSGAVLDEIARNYPDCSIEGFDISPQLGEFWSRRVDTIGFHQSDFLATGETADLILLLDVFEHVEDYMGFLRELSFRARHFIFHIPLDLFALASLTENYTRKRSEVGHLHYFTEATALATLSDCGFGIVDHKLTKPGLFVTTKYTRLLRAPRAIGDVLLGPRINARIFGGYALAVLCEGRIS